jgi:hypothetical protein
LLLFYDAAWVDFLNVVGTDFKFDEFLKAGSAAQKVSEGCKGEVNSPVRVITAVDLAEFVNTLRGDRPGEEALRWRRFFVSERKRMLYESSKVVEAMVRLRHIGSGIPVLRIDEDVLQALTEQTRKGPQAQDRGTELFGRMLVRAQMNHRHCVESSEVYSFVFSGGYRDEGEGIPEAKGFAEWATAFSTRVYPALFATKELLEHDTEQDLDTFASTVSGCHAFSDEIANLFYGSSTPVSALGGISKFGADPRKAVISGALFCLSDGAILDLPPFSNFGTNVVWIDDHLKYALLKALGYVGQRLIEVPSLDNEPDGKRDLTARIPHCWVPKGRPQIKNFGRYLLGDYLPSLLRGIIMDRWIYSDPSRKPFPHPIAAGPFATALRAALTRGLFDQRDELYLRQKLETLAIERINEVRKEWQQLRDKGKGTVGLTFASIWVDSKVREQIENVAAHPQWADAAHPEWAGRSWIGWGLVRDETKPSKPVRKENLAPALADDLASLIDDTVTYIDWALQWPQFVQAVRALPMAPGLDLREGWGDKPEELRHQQEKSLPLRRPLKRR